MKNNYPAIKVLSVFSIALLILSGACRSKNTNPAKTITYEKVVELCKNAEFINALKEINSQDSKEHVISFGRHDKKNIIASKIATGGVNSGIIPDVENHFADLHNHITETPPHSGDIYGFIERSLADKNYETQLVITPKGALYALVLEDANFAANFILRYPKVAGINGYQPTFPAQIVDEEREIRYKYGLQGEISIAYILSKYNTGVALLKRDSLGVFKKQVADELEKPTD